MRRAHIEPSLEELTQQDYDYEAKRDEKLIHQSYRVETIKASVNSTSIAEQQEQEDLKNG